MHNVSVPTRKQSASIAAIGVTRTQLYVQEDLGWLFREQPTEDYGIDAQVEIVDGDKVRGRLLAFQIKSGESWFDQPTAGGWWFRPDEDGPYPRFLDTGGGLRRCREGSGVAGLVGVRGLVV
ncbi:DUF4365 domain-containing protein, partial [Kribbella solani]|uniref:DUF4365 domain-containing protein n=1 Tax=Kribbella solani TaxID=236067 RepID=UPI0038D456A5